MTARWSKLQMCWSLAQRALSCSTTSTLPAMQTVSANSVESCRSAITIAACHLHGRTLTGNVAPIRFVRNLSQAAVAEQSQPDIQLTEAAVERIRQLSNKGQDTVLRLRVDAGGCSGFSYKFDLETDHASDDIVVQQHGVQLATDAVSYELLKGATVDYTTDLIRASFEVTQNPNASGKCGCGASFEPKM